MYQAGRETAVRTMCQDEADHLGVAVLGSQVQSRAATRVPHQQTHPLAPGVGHLGGVCVCDRE